MRNLKLYLLSETGTEKIADIFAEETEIGRAPSVGGITVESKSVSSSHGAFLSQEDFWFYQDLGSTNGSRINGKAIVANSPVLLRNGDILSLADIDYQVELENVNDACLIIFFETNLNKIHYLSSKETIRFGGIGSNFPVADATSIVLTIESLTNSFSAKCFPGKVIINGEKSTFQELKDLDEIRSGQYRIIVNNPKQSANVSNVEATLSEINLDKTIVKSEQFFNLEFGNVEDTASIVKDSGIWSEQNKINQRVESQSVFMQKQKQDKVNTTEDKLILLLSIIFGTAIFILLIWWLIK